MKTTLPPDFFNRPTLIVAQELLGKFLVRRYADGSETALRIEEVEVYDGFGDRASHAYRGKTERNSIMFGPAGFWYVYFVYGVHFLLNIVTGPENYPAAILIRGAGDMSGPAKLTKILGIDKTFNGKPALPESGLWIEDRGAPKNMKIQRMARIGVAYAGPVWSKKLYRLLIN